MSGVITFVTIILLAVIGLAIGAFLVFAGKKFEVEVDPKEAAVRECLPGNNCGDSMSCRRRSRSGKDLRYHGRGSRLR